jgi:cbb3-type cytochrome oxidase maturation protein
MFELTAIQFLVALFMGLGALCAFIWGALSGMFTNVEDVAREVYRREVPDDDESDERTA